MNKIVKKSNTKEEAIATILSENNISENDIVYLKNKIDDEICITAFLKEEINQEICIFLKEAIKGLGFDINIVSKEKDGRVIVSVTGATNSVLIGKNGQTIKALEILAKQKIFVDTGINYKFNLDIENYREERIEKLVKFALKTAKEVELTKIAVKLDQMTSYERRIIHNAVVGNEKLVTYSEGIEPNRYIVIDIKK